MIGRRLFLIRVPCIYSGGFGLNFAGTGCPWVHTRSFSSLAPTLGIVVSSGGVGFTSAGPVGL